MRATHHTADGPRWNMWALVALLFAVFAGYPTPANGQTAGVAEDSLRLERNIRPGLVQPRDWLLGAVLLGSMSVVHVEGLEGLDDAIKPDLERKQQWYRRIPRDLGSFEVTAGLSAGTFLLGELAGSSTASRIGLRALEALAVNSVLTLSLKVGVGRSRPDTGADGDQFNPFSFHHDNWSFPSGHTSTAFAVATIASFELGEQAPWVPFVAYPLATATGLSRMLDSRHWLTDVVAGASVGIFSALVVERLHGEPRPDAEGTASRPPRARLLLGAGESPLVGLSLSLR